MENEGKKDLINFEEAAKILGKTIGQAVGFILKNDVPINKNGPRPMISKASLETRMKEAKDKAEWKMPGLVKNSSLENLG